MNLRTILKKIKPIKYYFTGRIFYNDKRFLDVQDNVKIESEKRPFRSEIINFLLSLKNEKTTYLEIGVRNPSHNFDHIKADFKHSVDPGKEYKLNPVEFKMTSDEFFAKLDANEILTNEIKFDVIFIDGLHYAEQVDRDIQNSLKYIKNDGFIVLHDCNPPSEWHAIETYDYRVTPALNNWNGTTWKAFVKWRSNPEINSCCIDTDWGVGVLSKEQLIGDAVKPSNPFYEYLVFEKNKKEILNLISFEEFKRRLLKK